MCVCTWTCAHVSVRVCVCAFLCVGGGTNQQRCPQRSEKSDPYGAMELQVVINSQTWGPTSATRQKKYMLRNTPCSNTEGS